MGKEEGTPSEQEVKKVIRKEPKDIHPKFFTVPVELRESDFVSGWEWVDLGNGKSSLVRKKKENPPKLGG